MNEWMNEWICECVDKKVNEEVNQCYNRKRKSAHLFIEEMLDPGRDLAALWTMLSYKNVICPTQMLFIDKSQVAPKQNYKYSSWDEHLNNLDSWIHFRDHWVLQSLEERKSLRNWIKVGLHTFQ